MSESFSERAQRIIDNPQMPWGGSESGEEAWFFTHDFLAEFAREALRMREALEPFAKIADEIDAKPHSFHMPKLRLPDIYRARLTFRGE